MIEGNIFAKAAQTREHEQAKAEQKATEKKAATKARKAEGSGKDDASAPATVLISLSLEEKKKLKFAAIERNTSVSALVREFIATL